MDLEIRVQLLMWILVRCRLCFTHKSCVWRLIWSVIPMSKCHVARMGGVGYITNLHNMDYTVDKYPSLVMSSGLLSCSFVFLLTSLTFRAIKVQSSSFNITVVEGKISSSFIISLIHHYMNCSWRYSSCCLFLSLELGWAFGLFEN